MAFLQCDFTSEVLDLDCSLNAVVPEDREGPHPVLWLLHGLSDDHTTWMRRTSIERYAAEAGLAVVMPAVNRSFYWDMARGLRWGAFVREELPQIARRLFPLSSERKDNAIAGLSMGGYGALLAAFLHPERYAAAASLSGVLDPAMRIATIRQEDPDRLPEYENIFGDLSKPEVHPANIQYLLRQQVESGASLPALYACCGTEDFLYEENRSFRLLAEELGVPLTYEEGPGGHTWDFWDAWIQRVIRWMSEI